MKTILLLAITSLIAVAWSASARALPSRSLGVGVYDNPPLVFRDASGASRGLLIDVLSEAAREHGLALSMEHGEWEPLLSRLEAGSLDLLVAVAYSEERAQRIAYGTQTVFTNWGSLALRPGRHAASLLDLQGVRLAYVPKDIYGEDLKLTLEKFGVDFTTVACADYAGVHAALREGRADAGVASRLYNALYLDENGLAPTPIVFKPVEIRFAAGSPEGAQALRLIDESLAELKANPKSEYYAAVDRWLGAARPAHLPSWLPSVVISLVALVLGLTALSMLLRRRVAARTAELDARNEALSAEIDERSRVEERLRTSLREKDVMLAEIHHRVKNNLQVVHSLLSLQSQNVADPATRLLIQESRDRVRSMSLVHEKLYAASDFSGIDVPSYLREVARGLAVVYRPEGDVTVDVRAEADLIDLERAVPLGLVVNELVTNALKHAFPAGGRGLVSVRWSIGGKERTLEVRDDGKGLPAGFDPSRCESLGMRLVSVLSSQLDASLAWESDPGAVFRLTLRSR